MISKNKKVSGKTQRSGTRKSQNKNKTKKALANVDHDIAKGCPAVWEDKEKQQNIPKAKQPKHPLFF